MPNTNPSDLDREALEAAYAAFDDGENLNNLAIDTVIRAYLNALPRASGVPEAEAVARIESAFIDGWNAVFSQYRDVDTAFAASRWARADRAAPPPVAAPSAEALRYAAQFLIDRLEDFELDETNAKEMCRQYLGFVEPAIARLKMAMASPIASGAEPRRKLKIGYLVAGEEGVVARRFKSEEDAKIYANALNAGKFPSMPAETRQQMTRDEQAEAVDTAKWSHPIRPSTYELVDALNAHGYRITRTAPSGAKP